MRVLVDTNVVLSAALRDRDPETVVLWIVRTPGVEWIATRDILREYLTVLRRPKFGLSAGVLERWDHLIAAAVQVLPDPPPVPWLGDAGDAMFVACAAAAAADVLITGDRGVLEAGRLGQTLILTVAQFKDGFCERAGS